MQSIKYCMLFFVFILSVLIGKYISKEYIYRLEELEEIKNVLNIFKSKIKFTYEPIPVIFEEISRNTNHNISKLFIVAKEKMENNVASVSWEQAVDEVSCNLNEEDKQKIKTLSKLLRNNRCRRSDKSNRGDRYFFRWTDKTSTRRKE